MTIGFHTTPASGHSHTILSPMIRRGATMWVQ